MKKYCYLLLLGLLFCQKLLAGASPVGLALVPPVQFPPEKWDVYGLRLSPGYAKHYGVYGLDIGLLNTAEKGVGLELGLVNIVKKYSGLQLGLVNLTTDSYLLQIGILNKSRREFGGLQLGLINITKEAMGLQLGLVNYAEDLHGVQIGLFNINRDGPILFFPGINIGF